MIKSLVLLLILLTSAVSHANLCDKLMTDEKAFSSIEWYAEAAKRAMDPAFNIKHPLSVGIVNALKSTHISYTAKDDPAPIEALIKNLDALAAKGIVNELIIKDTGWTSDTIVGPKITFELLNHPRLLSAIESFRIFDLNLNESQTLSFLDQMPNLRHLDLGIEAHSPEFFRGIATRIASGKSKIGYLTFGIMNFEAAHLTELLPVKDQILGLMIQEGTISRAIDVLPQFTNAKAIKISGMQTRETHSGERELAAIVAAIPQVESLTVIKAGGSSLFGSKQYYLELSDLPLLAGLPNLKKLRIEVAPGQIDAYESSLKAIFGNRPVAISLF